jgi:nitrate reductase NapE component
MRLVIFCLVTVAWIGAFAGVSWLLWGPKRKRRPQR